MNNHPHNVVTSPPLRQSPALVSSTSIGRSILAHPINQHIPLHPHNIIVTSPQQNYEAHSIPKVTFAVKTP